MKITTIKVNHVRFPVEEPIVNAPPMPTMQRDFLTVTMSDVSITDVHQHADDDGITETVSVSAGHVTFEYRPTSPDGSLEPAVKFDWDIGKNAVK